MNEITINLALNLSRVGQPNLVNWESGAIQLNQNGSRASQSIQTVDTVADPLQLGSVGTLGYMILRNLDTFTNNTISVLTAVDGICFTQLGLNGIALIPVGSDVVAPYIIAASTPANVEIIILEL